MAAPFSFPCCECAAALVAVRNVPFETVPAHMQVRAGTIPQSGDREHTYGRQAVPFSRSSLMSLSCKPSCGSIPIEAAFRTAPYRAPATRALVQFHVLVEQLETDCVAGHVGFEPANPSASYLIGFA